MNAVTMRMSKVTVQLETGNSLQIHVCTVNMRLAQFFSTEQFGNSMRRSGHAFCMKLVPEEIAALDRR